MLDDGLMMQKDQRDKKQSSKSLPSQESKRL